jgi:hypothetical protein
MCVQAGAETNVHLPHSHVSGQLKPTKPYLHQIKVTEVSSTSPLGISLVHRCPSSQFTTVQIQF